MGDRARSIDALSLCPGNWSVPRSGDRTLPNVLSLACCRLGLQNAGNDLVLDSPFQVYGHTMCMALSHLECVLYTLFSVPVASLGARACAAALPGGGGSRGRFCSWFS